MENKEKTVAVICEYNPFHYGHKYQIDKLRAEYGTVVGIMSGSFVQRGEVAVADKYSRAAAAVTGGMDLVLELPFPYCVASGADFATAGARLAATVGVDSLAFGAEDGGRWIAEIADLCSAESFEKEVAAAIKAEPSLSYPKAKCALTERYLGAEAAAVLAKPNNLLAVEYLTAIKGENLPLTPFAVERDMSLESATEIRAAAEIAPHVPYPEFFAERRRIEYMERHLLYLMREGVDESLYCMGKELAATLRNAARQASELKEAVALATGKVYTAARVRRAIVAAWLGIRAEEVKAPPAYTALLAATQRGTAFMKKLKKNTALPVLTKPARYKELEGAARAQAERTLMADEAAAMCVPALGAYGTALAKTPFILKG
ncbi:MAG: nucleotidyltransferase family protein [Clostridia bacterium]|nr:nucleotidyltransferase family protein [Clostridia bacterium]